MEQGYLHVYTGDGKGKTTAAMGLALRSLGAGFRVQIIQFIKNAPSSEISPLEKAGAGVFRYGNGLIFGRPITEEDRQPILKGLNHVKRIFTENSTDLLILDEINVALGLQLAEEALFFEILSQRPPTMEVVCTGRRAPQALLDTADLITEMQAQRHYYQQGVASRLGIER